jgi:hypothetical protein
VANQFDVVRRARRERAPGIVVVVASIGPRPDRNLLTGWNTTQDVPAVRVGFNLKEGHVGKRIFQSDEGMADPHSS